MVSQNPEDWEFPLPDDPIQLSQPSTCRGRSSRSSIDKLESFVTGRKSACNRLRGWSYTRWRPSSGIWRMFWKHQCRPHGDPPLWWYRPLPLASRPTQSLRRRTESHLHCRRASSHSRVFACVNHLVVEIEIIWYFIFYQLVVCSCC
jgi:hypothetical protein